MKVFDCFMFKRLAKIDLLILAGFLTMILLGNFLNSISLQKAYFEYLLIISIGLYILTLTSFSGRFRNLSFALPWIILTVYYHITSGFNFTFLPLVGVNFTLLIRLLYWNIYKTEFVVMNMRRGNDPKPIFCKSINKKSKDTDKIFSFIQFVGGIIILSIIMG